MHKIFTLSILALFGGFCPQLGFSQSISGNVNMSTASLGYANVDIYRGDVLVANVLTDYGGNFNVKLDTGTYKCVINYAGYESVTKEIKVTNDVKSDFNLKADDKSKYYRFSHDLAPSFGLTDGTAVTSGTYSWSGDEDYLTTGRIYRESGVKASYVWGNHDGDAKTDSASYGKLTAAEINDFSKWKLWTDLTKDDLKVYQANWYFAPSDRYVLQLTDKNGLPLANAHVELLNDTILLFEARTDNTGKAELWETLKYNELIRVTSMSIKVIYKGETKTIHHAKKFDKGINHMVINAKCEQPQNVEIAMVVDATGSMQDEIDYLKMDLNDVIYQSKTFSNTLNFSFANVFYRDQGEIYVSEAQDFTRVLSESVAYTNRHNADGGGDDPEAVEVALDHAINQLNWTEDTRTKILFLVLDAPPHNTTDVQNKIRKLCYQAAAKGIRIVPIVGSGAQKETEYLMRAMALATNGTYIFLSDHSGIGGEHLAPSTDNYSVEILNDLLVRVIKSFTYMPDCKQEIADLGVNLPDSQVVVLNEVDSLVLDTIQTSTSRDSVELKWSFYPNPTNGIVNIVSNKEIKELYITDLGGKALFVIKDILPDRMVTVDLGEFASGIYLIRYPIGKSWISGKIVLSRN